MVFMNEGENLLQKKEHSPSPSINSAKDINDVSKYVDLCSSTFVKPVVDEKKNTSEPPKRSSYKDCTMKFSLNKISKPKKAEKASSEKDNTMKYYFQTFKSPLYGERGEDICFNSEY